MPTTKPDQPEDLDANPTAMKCGRGGWAVFWIAAGVVLFLMWLTIHCVGAPFPKATQEPPLPWPMGDAVNDAGEVVAPRSLLLSAIAFWDTPQVLGPDDILEPTVAGTPPTPQPGGIFILSISVRLTNTLPYGATYGDQYTGGNYATNATYDATFTYTAPAGVYVMQIYGQELFATGLLPGFSPFGWYDLNNWGWSYTYPPPRGYFTNSVAGTNSTTQPVPYWFHSFYRMRKAF